MLALDGAAQGDLESPSLQVSQESLDVESVFWAADKVGIVLDSMVWEVFSNRSDSEIP